MYLAMKTAHILSVIIFLGNIITGVFWMRHANRSGSPAVAAHAMAGIIRSDTYFTMPSVVAIVVTGVALAEMANMAIFGTAWIGASLILFAISGLLFGAFLAPLQRRLLSQASGPGSERLWPTDEYRRAFLIWESIGIVAIVLPLAAVALMVFKPADIL